ncbi:MAG: type II toxin-antitoxin system VapB family antitoxin [Coriobacteriales bacterium]|jgi:Arc/MetJ family transcription regulator|nr:type II toxin-antitoxin system VapB family antitoxin [Coriobacteriales bacterium]
MVRTNIVIDDSLIEQVMSLARVKTKREAVNTALHEYVLNRSRSKLSDLAGSIDFYDDYDYKALREGRNVSR